MTRTGWTELALLYHMGGEERVRKRLLLARRGRTLAEAAAHLGVSVATLCRWSLRVRVGGLCPDCGARYAGGACPVCPLGGVTRDRRAGQLALRLAAYEEDQ